MSTNKKGKSAHGAGGTGTDTNNISGNNHDNTGIESDGDNPPPLDTQAPYNAMMHDMQALLSQQMRMFTSMIGNLQSEINALKLSATSDTNKTSLNHGIKLTVPIVKIEGEGTIAGTQASPGSDAANTIKSESKTDYTSSSSTMIVQPALPTPAAPTQEMVINEAITKRNPAGNNATLLKTGATLTKHGAIMKFGKKVQPHPAREPDLRTIANAAGTMIVTLTGKDDRLMVSSILTLIGIEWPHSTTLDAQELKLPSFEPGYAHSVTGFIKWQNKIIDDCKRAGLQDILLKPLDYLVNQVLNVNFSIGAGNNNQNDVASIKAAIIRAFYDISKQLFFLLKETLSREPFILDKVLEESKSMENDEFPVFIEGNANYLWRCLDENYHRITTSAIEEANKRLDSIKYGPKGKDSYVTSIATNSIVIAIQQANRDLADIDRPRSDDALKSLLLSRLPNDLFNFIQSVTVNNNYENMKYTDLCGLIITHSRTLEERKDTRERRDINAVTTHGGDAQKKGKGSGAGTASAKTKHCTKCKSTTHNTTDHFDCPKCKKAHHPNYCPMDKNKKGVNTVSTQETGSAPKAHTLQSPSADSDSRTFICQVNVKHYNEKVVQVNYAAGDITFDVDRQCIIDTGGAAHIACSEKYLYNVTTIQPPVYVTLPDGSEIKVKKYGSMMLTKDFVLTRVLLVPEFRVNIVSVALMTDRGASVRFDREHCVIHKILDNGRLAPEPIAKVKRNDGNVYVHYLPKQPYLPKVHPIKKLTPSQLVAKPKQASYGSTTGDLSTEPTTIKAITAKQRKIPKVGAEGQSSANSRTTRFNAASNGGPGTSATTVTNDQAAALTANFTLSTPGATNTDADSSDDE